MKLLAQYFQTLIQSNQLPQLEQTCRELSCLNQFLKANGLPYIVREKGFVPDPTPTLAPEMALAVCRFFYDHMEDKAVYVCQLYQVGNFYAGEALIQEGVLITANIRKMLAYQSLKEEHRNLLEAQCSLVEMQRKILKSDFKYFEDDLAKVASLDIKTLADYLNSIAEQKIENPFSMNQWGKLVDVIEKHYKGNLAKHLHADYATYRHPDAQAASSTDLSQAHKDMIISKVKDLINDLKKEQNKLSLEETAKLNQYFSLLSKKQKVEVGLALDVEMILDQHHSRYNFYIENLQELCGIQGTGFNSQIKQFFIEQLSKKLSSTEKVQRYSKVMSSTLTAFDQGMAGSFWGGLLNKTENKKTNAEWMQLLIKMANHMNLSPELKAVFYFTVISEEILTYFRDQNKNDFSVFFAAMLENQFFMQNIASLSFSFLNVCFKGFNDEELESRLFSQGQPKLAQSLILKFLLDNNKDAMLEKYIASLKESIKPEMLVTVAKRNHLQLFTAMWLRAGQLAGPSTINQLMATPGLGFLEVIVNSDYFIKNESRENLFYDTYDESRYIHSDYQPSLIYRVAQLADNQKMKFLFEHPKTKGLFTRANVKILITRCLNRDEVGCVEYLLSIFPDKDYAKQYDPGPSPSCFFRNAEKHQEVTIKALDSGIIDFKSKEFIDYMKYDISRLHWVLEPLIVQRRLSKSALNSIIAGAINQHCVPAIEYLLKAKCLTANTVFVDEKNATALMYAISRIHYRHEFNLDAVNLLLATQEIDFSVVDAEGATLVDYCLDLKILHSSTHQYNYEFIPVISELLRLDLQFKLPKLEQSLNTLMLMEQWAKTNSGILDRGFIFDYGALSNKQLGSKSKSDHQEKLLKKMHEVQDQLCAHWLKQLLQKDEDACALFAKDKNKFLKQLQILASNDATLPESMRKRAQALCILFMALDSCTNSNFVFSKEDKIQQAIEKSLLIMPTIAICFVNKVIAEELSNPLTPEKWLLFKKAFQMALKNNSQFKGQFEFAKLHESFRSEEINKALGFESGIVSQSASSSTSTTSTSDVLSPAAIAKVQGCANEVVEALSDDVYSDADRLILQSLFAPAAKELAAFDRQQEQRVQARKILIEKNDRLVLSYLATKGNLAEGDIKPGQEEWANKLFTDKVLDGLKPKSKAVEMTVMPSAAVLVSQSSSLMSLPNVPTQEPVEIKNNVNTLAPAQ